MQCDLNAVKMADGAVVRPVPGQAADFCGIGACGAFRDLLLNSLDSARYSSGVITSGTLAAAGADLTFASLSGVSLFVSAQGDAANAGTGTTPATAEGLWFAVSPAQTNQTVSEAPVPRDFLFCAVGMAVSVDPAYQRGGTGSAAVDPIMYSQWIDAAYNSALQTAILNNVAISLAFGNQNTTFQLGLLREYPYFGGAAGGSQIRNGVIAAPLMFTPFNSVVCVGIRDEVRKLVMKAQVGQAFTVESIGANPSQQPTAQVVDTAVRVPFAVYLYGFVIGKPGTDTWSMCAPR